MSQWFYRAIRRQKCSTSSTNGVFIRILDSQQHDNNFNLWYAIVIVFFVRKFFLQSTVRDFRTLMQYNSSMQSTIIFIFYKDVSWNDSCTFLMEEVSLHAKKEPDLTIEWAFHTSCAGVLVTSGCLIFAPECWFLMKSFWHKSSRSFLDTSWMLDKLFS